MKNEFADAKSIMIDWGESMYKALLSKDAIATYKRDIDACRKIMNDIVPYMRDKYYVTIKEDVVDDLTSYTLLCGGNTWTTGYVNPDAFTVAVATITAILNAGDDAPVMSLFYYIADDLPNNIHEIDETGISVVLEFIYKFTRDLASKGV